MTRRLFVRVFMVVALLVAASALPVAAGGPVCPPPGCGPIVCAPPLCPPPLCVPPRCGPPRCGPPRCAPYPCKPNPLAQICEGAVRLVKGVVALPFKVVGCVVNSLSCPPRCCPKPVCRPPRMACAPPICVPPYIFGPPVGYMPPRPPVGFGHRAPRRFSPMAHKQKAVQITLMAGPGEGFFGAYW